MELLWGFYLGWGWPWLIFLIALVISLVIAVRTRPIAWLLPALVLYVGLDWHIPDIWFVPLMLIFKIVFWIAVIVAVISAFRDKVTSREKFPFNLMSGLIAFLLLLSVVTGLWNMVGSPFGSPDEEPKDNPTGLIDLCDNILGTQDEIPKGTEDNGTGNCVEIRVGEEPDIDTVSCPERFEQSLDPNRQNRFVSDGFEGLPREKRMQLVAAVGRDYRYLHFFAEQLFDRDINRRSLRTADGDCLSQRGQRLFMETKGALMASGVENGTASPTSYNTGMEDGEAVVSSRRGLYGDRSATVYTMADGTRVVVLDRCGNMALPSQPEDVPEGKTDNPPPPQNTPPDTPPNNPPTDTPPEQGKDPSEEPAQQGNVPDQVQGENPGTGGQQASQPAAEPVDEYEPPSPPSGGGGGGGGSNDGDDGHNPPPPEADTPTSDPSSDPCEQNPDFCP